MGRDGVRAAPEARDRGGRAPSARGQRPGGAPGEAPESARCQAFLTDPKVAQANEQGAGPQRPAGVPPSSGRPRARPASAGSTRPAFLGGRLTTTTWYRSYGPRAYEEELQPAPLSPVPIHEATPLEQQLAYALGLEEETHWPRLPMEVGSCEQGGRCCWRWLARAALERAAGAPMSHLNLAEMVAHVRSELASLAELRKWQVMAEEELEQAAKDRQEASRLRMAFSSTEAELREVRNREAALLRVQAENTDLQDANRELKVREQRMQRELMDLQAEKQLLIEGDLAAAKTRAGQAEKELTEAFKTKLDHKVLNEDLNRQLLRERRELERQKEENARLRQEWEAAVRKKTRRRRRPGSSKQSSPSRGRR